MQIVNDLFSFLYEKFIWISVFLKQYDILILLSLIVIFAIFRIVLSNQLVVKRKETTNWIVYGSCNFLSILAFFIKVPSISLIANLMSIALMVLTLLFSNSKKSLVMINSAIYDYELAFKENVKGPSGFQKIWEGEDAAYEKMQEKINKAPIANISHSLSLNGMKFINGIPVLSHNFKFVMSVTANKEQFYHVSSMFSNYFKDYNWIGMKKDKYFIYTAYPKSLNKNDNILKFDNKISSFLPWYCIPLGAISAGSNKSNNIKDSLYYWLMHNDGNLYTDKSTASFFSNNINKNYIVEAPMGLIAGGTGGGKSVLLKTIIAHLSNHNVKLYLSDPKGGAEFGKFNDINNVKVAIDLKSSYNIFKEFCKEMNFRYKAMGKLGINKIPLDGDVSKYLNDRFIIINNKIFLKNETISISIAPENNVNLQTLFENKINIQAGEIINYLQNIANGNRCIFINIDKNEDLGTKAYWEIVPVNSIKNITNNESIKDIGYHFDPMIFISDEYAQLLSFNDSTPLEILNQIDEIRTMVESIARLGRAANIHLILATQSINNTLFPASLKNNLHFRSICGPVTQDISRSIIGTEEGETIPTEPAGMYLSYCKNNTVMYQGFYTTAEDVIKINKYNHNLKSDYGNNDDNSYYSIEYDDNDIKLTDLNTDRPNTTSTISDNHYNNKISDKPRKSICLKKKTVSLKNQDNINSQNNQNIKLDKINKNTNKIKLNRK